MKNLFLWPGRSLIRKGLEAYLAVMLEVVVPKARILELYLNTIELGPGVDGVPAASRLYFGVEPTELSLEQSALIAAVLPNPVRMRVSSPSEYLRQRQVWIVEQAERMHRDDWLGRIVW